MVLQQSTKRARSSANRKTKAIPMLPPEMIFEILTWLSVQNLLRMKTVCKEWCAMIEEPAFIKKHLRRGQCFAIAYNDNAIGFPNCLATCGVLSDIYVMISCCYGLLLQRTLFSSRYFIRNPATRRTLDLPDPHMDSLGMALAYVRSTDKYKVVSLYTNPDEASREGCEVIDIGDHGDLTWKQLKLPGLIEADSRGKKLVMVTTAKAIHFVNLLTTFSYYIQVDSLDLVTDTFTSSMLPKRVFSNLCNIRAFSAGGRLAIGATDVEKKNMHIWLLKDHKKSKWADSPVVYFLNCLASRDAKRAIPLFIQRGMLWLWVDGKKLIAYDTFTKTVFHTEVAPRGTSISGRIYFNPCTLVSLKGMRLDTENSLTIDDCENLN